MQRLRHAAREAVDVGHREGHLGLLRHGQQMQNSIRGAAHGDVQRHGVLEGLKGRDAARQHRCVVLLVVALGQIDDRPPRLQEDLLAVGVRGQHASVAGQPQAQSLDQAVHRVGGKHSGTRAAGGAGRALVLLHIRVAHLGIAGDDHRVDQVHGLDDIAAQLDLARFHRPAGDKDHGNVQAHGGHQHSRRDLVAVGDADQRVGAMGIDHVLDRIGDQVARGQAVEHSVVAHGDAVVDGDGVELLGDAARALDLPRHELAQVLQVDVAGNKLGEGVGDGDDGLAEIAVLHSGGAPQRARSGHIASMRRGSRTINWHNPDFTPDGQL